MGRKPYSKVVDGKVVAPPPGIECGARPTPMKHKAAAMVTPSGINGDLSLSIAELKAENAELNEHSASQLGQIIQLQKRLREKEKEVDDQKMAFNKRKRIAECAQEPEGNFIDLLFYGENGLPISRI